MDVADLLKAAEEVHCVKAHTKGGHRKLLNWAMTIFNKAAHGSDGLTKISVVE